MSKTKIIAAIAAGALAVIGLLFVIPTRAGAEPYAHTMTDDTDAVDYGSGAPAGPVGTQVLSLPDYTSRSHWAIFGDSITKGGYKQLAAQKPDYRLAVNAHGGRNTKLTVDSLQQMLADGYVLPKRIIWATGSNDVMSPFVMPAQLQRMLALLPASVESVYMVDVQVNRPAFSPDDQRNSMMVNKAIWEACAKDSRCTLISWSSFLAAKPGYRIGAYLDAGGVHPAVPYGYETWAKLLADQVIVP